MFSAFHTNPKYLLSVFQTIELINPNINILLSEEGLILQIMNISHTGIFNSKIDKSSFQSYSVDKSQRVGVQLKYLIKILDLMDAEDNVEFSITDTKLDVLTITRRNKSKTSIFVIKLLDIDQTEFDNSQFPDEYEIELRIQLNQFINDIKEMMVLESESITICSDNSSEKVSFSSESDQGTLYTTIDSVKKAEDLNMSIYQLVKCNITTELSIALEYLCAIFKMNHIATHVTLLINENQPLKVNIETDDLNEFHYYIAPKFD